MSIPQIMILILGAIAIYCTNSLKYKRIAPIFGLISQPFWLYETWYSDSMGIFLLSCFYTYSWSLGIYNNYFRKIK